LFGQAGVRLYGDFGLDLKKVRVLPSFSVASKKLKQEKLPSRWVAAGRFEPEKGFVELIEAWPDEFELHIYGWGSQVKLLSRMAKIKGNISILQALPQDAFRDVLSEYLGLILPSIWFEPFGGVLTESFAASRPAIALDYTVAGDIIRQTGAGLALESLSILELRRALSHISHDYANFCLKARVAFEERYSASAWVHQVARLIDSLVGARVG
jgi:glycosyltransferase involved in cell wall biosynthesis